MVEPVGMRQLCSKGKGDPFRYEKDQQPPIGPRGERTPEEGAYVDRGDSNLASTPLLVELTRKEA